MKKHQMKYAPIAILSLLLIFQAACRGSEYLISTVAPQPSATLTEESAPETPQSDALPTDAQSDTNQGLRNFVEIGASNAADLIQVNSIGIGAPLADFFIAPEIEGYSLWVAVFNDGDTPARLEHWDLYTNQVIRVLASGEINSPKSLSGTPDGGMLVTLDESSVALWDVYSGKLPFDEFEYSPWFEEALIPPSTGMLLAVGYASTDGSLVLFDLNTYQMIDVWFHEDYVIDIDFSTDGAYLASGAANGTVKVIDVNSSAETLSLSKDGWVDSVAIEVSPIQANGSGHILATSVSGTITLMDIANRTQITDLAGHSSDVIGMDFSPNGEVLASGDRGGLLKLWDVSSGNEILSLNVGSGEIVRVAFSPDGTLLAAGTTDGRVTIWSVRE